jgi:hypothetical protein
VAVAKSYTGDLRGHFQAVQEKFGRILRENVTSLDSVPFSLVVWDRGKSPKGIVIRFNCPKVIAYARIRPTQPDLEVRDPQMTIAVYSRDFLVGVMKADIKAKWTALKELCPFVKNCFSEDFEWDKIQIPFRGKGEILYYKYNPSFA